MIFGQTMSLFDSLRAKAFQDRVWNFQIALSCAKMDKGFVATMKITAARGF